MGEDDMYLTGGTDFRDCRYVPTGKMLSADGSASCHPHRAG